MTLTIRKATPQDLPEIMDMVREFAEYEQLLEYLTVKVEDLREAMFDDNGFVECLVARDGDRAVGYAFYFPYFASFRGQRGFFLEDLFVRSDSRGSGVGGKLLRAVAREASSRGFSRIDLQVLTWNTPAVQFYNSRGALTSEDERHLKFVDEAFQSLAST
jgi:GNAT superfamily N-acetyltransferase